MGAAACLRIDASDVNNSELVTRNDTSLVKTKPVLLFSFCLVHEAFGNIHAVTDQSVGVVFNFKLFFSAQ